MEIEVTRRMAVCASAESKYGSLRPLMKFLELSGHGIPWFSCVLAGVFLTHDIGLHQQLLNLLFGRK